MVSPLVATVRVTIRFYAELNDFLGLEKRQVAFEQDSTGSESIKDMIRALGVPYTGVDLILVNGRSVDFSYLVQEGDRISVFPAFESIDIAPLLRLRPPRSTRPSRN